MFIIIICSDFYSFSFYRSSYSMEEGFTTKLGHIYRPYIRKARLFSENFYNNTTGSVSTFFRKIGLA